MRTMSGKGLTLFELLIVIIVMGILTTIAVPNYRIFMAQRRLNGAARMVMSDLMAKDEGDQSEPKSKDFL